MSAFGGSFNLFRFSCVLAVDAPRLNLRGLRFAMHGLAATRKKAIEDVQKMVDRRNALVRNEGLNPPEVMRLVVESMKFDVSEQVCRDDRIAVLQQQPRGLSADEITGGETGYLMNQSIESLLNPPEEIEDINTILL